LATNNSTVQIWDAIIKQYSEHHRHYHDKKHLAFCLQQLDLVVSLIEDMDAVEIAIWFHDMVHKSNASDNEEKSAALFKILVRPHFRPDFVDKVCDIILATKHINEPKNGNQEYMLDIDLSSLGLPWEQFYQDSSDLRAECGSIPNKRYYAGKLKFFDLLLDRPNIYYSEFFSTRYENSARNNLLRYRSLLKSKGYR